MSFLKKIMDFLIFIKHFVAKIVVNFLFISINLLLIIKTFVTKVVMNLYKILLDLLIRLKVFVAKLVLIFVEIIVKLWSKFVRNSLIISTKFWKFRSLVKFLRLMAFLTLFYQIISVTISYSEFETVIEMKATKDLKH
jgi:hypothetical protein